MNVEKLILENQVAIMEALTFQLSLSNLVRPEVKEKIKEQAEFTKGVIRNLV